VFLAKGTDDSSSDSGNNGNGGSGGSGGSAPNPNSTATDNTSSSSGDGSGEESGGGGREESGSGRGDESGGLSSGVSAGIGAGATFGIIAVAGGVFMLWRRRRQRSQERAAAAAAAGREMAEMGDNGWSQPPFGGYSGGPSWAGSTAGGRRHFADGRAAQKWELDAERSTVEAPTKEHRHGRHEMSA
jgi:hypothetical protein